MSTPIILYVDDEKRLLDALKDQLYQQFGVQYHYLLVKSIEDAWIMIEELTKNDVEVVMMISDSLIQKMKAHEFLTTIYRRFPKIVPIILPIQTGEDVIERAKKAVQLYCYLYRKPTEEELIGTTE